MKKTTLSILLALVFVLSLSAGSVFAQEWDEETVLTVFNDMQTSMPELFVDEDSDDLLNAESLQFPEETTTTGSTELYGKSADGSDYESKAFIDTTAGVATISGKFAPCGDGRIQVEITVQREVPVSSGYAYNTYLRSILIDVTNTTTGVVDYSLPIQNCKASGSGDCRMVAFNSAGQAKIKGYVQTSQVLQAADAITLNLTMQNSAYMTVFANSTSPVAQAVTATGTATASGQTYCQAGIVQSSNLQARGRYDQNTGEARVQIAIDNTGFTNRAFVVPAELMIYDPDSGKDKTYDSYTCRYTTMDFGGPRTDYCTPGEALRIPANSTIRFDLTVDRLNGVPDGTPLAVTWRVGGLANLISFVSPAAGAAQLTLEPRMFPGTPAVKISAMDPIKPMLTNIYNNLVEDNPIKASGAYSVYEGAVAGHYQKCGRMAYLLTRVRNDGYRDEAINLDNIAVAVNGGTPMRFHWIGATTYIGANNTVILAPGDDLILLGRAKITDMPSQMNSDEPITAAVNMIDYGLYMTGKLYSDHNNTNCVPPVAQ